jgi:hypothetical protein
MENHYNSESGDSEIFIVTYDNEEGDSEVTQETPIVWCSKGKPTEQDHEATLLLLSLREKCAAKFDDRKTTAVTIWQSIANEMEAARFKLGPKAGEKCRQKFTNLQNKIYDPHVRHMNKTGEKNKKTPMYFAELHNVLEAKDKCNPKHLLDTLSSDTRNEAGPSTSKTEVENRFAHTKKSVRVTGSNAQLIEILKTESNERKEQFGIITNLLQEQNHQRDRMLTLLEGLGGQKTKRPSED